MRRYHRTVISCRECKGQRQCQVVEKLTPHMLREGEESWTVFANCDGRDSSKYITYVKEVHVHAPGQ